jgi:hypothetical protein
MELDDVRSVALTFAGSNEIRHNLDTKVVGSDRLKGFRRRNPIITL